MIRMLLMTAAAVALAGCDRSEDYPLGVSETYGKVLSSAFSQGISPLPVGLAGADVSVRFQSMPTDRTAYWLFSKKGRELGRVTVAVSGDDAESTVSLDYAEGPGAEEFAKVARQVERHMPNLVAEAVDAGIEGRTPDEAMKKEADKATSLALVGAMMDDVQVSMDSAVARFDAQARERTHAANSRRAREATANATKPMMRLDGN